MRNAGFMGVILVIMALLDLYIFQILKSLSSTQTYRFRVILFSTYWIISGMVLVLLLLLPYLHYENWPKTLRSYVFATMVGLFFSKLVASVFFLIDDIRRGMMWIIGKLFSNPSVAITDGSEGINRSTFLSWLGLAVGGGLLGSLV